MLFWIVLLLVAAISWFIYTKYISPSVTINKNITINNAKASRSRPKNLKRNLPIDVTANLPPIRLNQIAQPLEQPQTATTTAASNPFASPLQPQRLNFLSPRAGQVNSFYNSNYNAYEDTTPSAPSVSINSFLDASSGSNSLRQRTFSQKGMKSPISSIAPSPGGRSLDTFVTQPQGDVMSVKMQPVASLGTIDDSYPSAPMATHEEFMQDTEYSTRRGRKRFARDETESARGSSPKKQRVASTHSEFLNQPRVPKRKASVALGFDETVLDSPGTIEKRPKITTSKKRKKNDIPEDSSSVNGDVPAKKRSKKSAQTPRSSRSLQASVEQPRKRDFYPDNEHMIEQEATEEPPMEQNTPMDLKSSVPDLISEPDTNGMDDNQSDYSLPALDNTDDIFKPPPMPASKQVSPPKPLTIHDIAASSRSIGVAALPRINIEPQSPMTPVESTPKRRRVLFNSTAKPSVLNQTPSRQKLNLLADDEEDKRAQFLLSSAAKEKTEADNKKTQKPLFDLAMPATTPSASTTGSSTTATTSSTPAVSFTTTSSSQPSTTSTTTPAASSTTSATTSATTPSFSFTPTAGTTTSSSSQPSTTSTTAPATTSFNFNTTPASGASTTASTTSTTTPAASTTTPSFSFNPTPSATSTASTTSSTTTPAASATPGFTMSFPSATTSTPAATSSQPSTSSTTAPSTTSFSFNPTPSAATAPSTSTPAASTTGGSTFTFGGASSQTTAPTTSTTTAPRPTLSHTGSTLFTSAMTTISNDKPPSTSAPTTVGFAFGGNSTPGTSSSTTTPSTPAAGGMFNFNPSAPSTTQPPTSASTTTGGFGFPTSTSTTSSAPTATTPAFGFNPTGTSTSFSTTPSSATTAPSTTSAPFGQSSSTAGGSGFGFNAPSTSQPSAPSAPTSGFGFNPTPSASTSSTPAFGFPSTPAASSTPSTSARPAFSGFGPQSTAPSSAPSAGFSGFTTTPQPSTTGPAFGSNQPSSSTAGGFPFGGASTPSTTAAFPAFPSTPSQPSAPSSGFGSGFGAPSTPTPASFGGTPSFSSGFGGGPSQPSFSTTPSTTGFGGFGGSTQPSAPAANPFATGSNTSRSDQPSSGGGGSIFDTGLFGGGGGSSASNDISGRRTVKTRSRTGK